MEPRSNNSSSPGGLLKGENDWAPALAGAVNTVREKMAMYIAARNPETAGMKGFQVGLTTWRALQDLMEGLGADLLSEELRHAMSFNDGYGPDGETAEMMAKRCEQWLETNPEGYAHSADCDLSAEYLRDWIQFLRTCGGFEVC